VRPAIRPALGDKETGSSKAKANANETNKTGCVGESTLDGLTGEPGRFVRQAATESEPLRDVERGVFNLLRRAGRPPWQFPIQTWRSRCFAVCPHLRASGYLYDD
jgi:hypothetical protein